MVLCTDDGDPSSSFSTMVTSTRNCDALVKKKATWAYSKVLVTMLSFTSADHRSHNIHHSGIDKFWVVITQTPIHEFCHYSRIFNRFAAFSSIPEPEGASGFWCCSLKYSTIPPTDKILVLTSMHQIDSKFSPTDKIQVVQEMYGKFCELSRIRMWIAEVRLFWHLSSFRKDIQRFVWPVAACQQMPFYDLTLELYEDIRSLNSIKCLLPIEKYSSHIPNNIIFI